ncbi:DNA polymerase III subunit beta [Actinoplanes derwentensis]|uniref:DNA polymerase III, beta subunit n=1 Tax=Actinoplanes derwentensis TaxID=113562 RepID=A0A1H2CW35_9ACTN|nr:DNA polymerase III subunit beta [Actinoplanes derwentensis]GID81969.1 hypothetical protein Ade03nite_08930 [Actinoplanes derwentensis]SDT74236.1 DNA polymerase III, beta subunit [Actinoplanes derwentensis]
MSTTDNQAPVEGHLTFVVPQPELLAALTFVGRAIPKKPPVPVLAGVILTSDGETVTIEAFDYDQSRTVTLPGATCTQPGTVLVSAANLLTRVKVLAKDRPIAFAGEGVQARLSNGKTTYTLPTMPVEDYPTRPDMPPLMGLVDGKALADQVAQATRFAGTDETLPSLTGIHLRGEGTTLHLVATDRYRVTVRDLDWANDVDKFTALVPAKLLTEVTKTIGQSPNVTLGYDPKGPGAGWFGIENATMRVVTRTLDGGTYPPVASLVPKAFVLDVDVDVASLISTIERVQVALTRALPVLMEFGPDTFTVGGGTDEDGAASETFSDFTFVTGTPKETAAAVKAAVKEAEKQARKRHSRDPKEVRDRKVAEAGQQTADALARVGAGMVVGANPDYLADTLKTAGSKRVRLRFVDPYKPFVAVPLDRDGQPLPGVTNLQMPIRIGETKDSIAIPPALTTGPETAEADAAGAAAEPTDDASASQESAAMLGDGPQAKPAGQPDISGQGAAVPKPSAAAPDRTTPHPFQRAVDDGRKTNPFTKCVCGTTRNAKVHGGRAAAAKETKQTALAAGPVWMAVLQLTARSGGQMVTEATVQAGMTAVRVFGEDTTTGVLVADTPDGKRMYVAVRSAEEAERMKLCALAASIPAHTAQGVWPPQGAAAVNEVGGEQVKAQEQAPVIVGGEPKFDPKATSLQAFNRLSMGDFDGALELIDLGMQNAPAHLFRGGGLTYGWETIQEAILAKQVEAEIAADTEKQALADIAAEAVADTEETDAADELTHGSAETGPETVAEREQEAAPIEGNPVAQRLREALAGHPEEVIEAAVAAAMAAAPTAAAAPMPRQTAPRPAAAKPEQPQRTVPAPRRAAAAVPSPAPARTAAAATGTSNWTKFGMTAPSTTGGERVWLLPAGTRLRALRKDVLDRLVDAKRDGVIAAMPSVEVEKAERPYRLRIRFATAGALTAANATVDRAVLTALPDVVPARVG